MVQLIKLSASSPHIVHKPDPHYPREGSTAHPQTVQSIPVHNVSISSYLQGVIETYHTNKAAGMPLSIESLDNHVRHRLPSALALRAEAMRMAVHTPCIPLFLHKRRRRVKWVAALRAEKVASVPFRAARDDDLALNGRLARLAPRREELVEVEVAEETLAFVCAVFSFEARHVVGGWVGGQHGDVLA